MYLRRHHYARINARSWFLGILFFCSCTSYSFMSVCLSTISNNRSTFLIIEMVITIIFIDYSQHEQSRTDRDDYIKIHWRNIIEGIDEPYSPQNRFVHINLIVLFIASGMAFNFQKHDQGRIQYLDQPYDTGIIISILIFSLSWFCLTEIGIVFFFNRFYYALRSLRFC